MGELAQLEQEALDERLSGADAIPTASIQALGPTKAPTSVEDDEAEQLRQLQASLAM
jgi:hypothetical protein